MQEGGLYFLEGHVNALHAQVVHVVPRSSSAADLVWSSLVDPVNQDVISIGSVMAVPTTTQNAPSPKAETTCSGVLT